MGTMAGLRASSQASASCAGVQPRARGGGAEPSFARRQRRPARERFGVERAVGEKDGAGLGAAIDQFLVAAGPPG